MTVHVTEGGGSFGRRLFFDGLEEAAECSKAFGKPVKLIWTRADDSRQGRTHPMATCRVRAQVSGDAVSSFEIRHTSVATEINPGLSEAISAAANKAPGGNLTVSESIYLTTQTNPYNVGVATSLLNEVDMRFNTCSMRNIYSPDTATARELMIDQVAAKMGKDPYEFRSAYTKLTRWKNVVDRAAKEADWGKSMPKGTAQGIAMHVEYKGVACAVVELDCRPETVDRKIRSARTGPRVTKVTYVVDGGLIINPRGFEAQMMGGINDGIAMTLTAGLHLVDGHFVEASWDNYFYTRQWNTPPEMNIVLIEDSEPRARRCRRVRRGRDLRRDRLRLRARHRHGADAVPDPAQRAAALRAVPDDPARAAVADQRPRLRPLRRLTCLPTPSRSTARRSPSTSRTTSVCSGSCGICWA